MSIREDIEKFQKGKKLKDKPPMAPKPPKELHPPKPSVKGSSDLILEKLDLILSILNLNPEAIEKGLRRAKSTIHKKPEVEKGTGAYYKDYTEWTLEIDKLQEFKKNRQALMV